MEIKERIIEKEKRRRKKKEGRRRNKLDLKHRGKQFFLIR